jgi:hypothetical protein
MYSMQETGDCAVGGLVSCDAGLGKELPRRPRRTLAEPSGDYVATAQRFRFRRRDGFGYRTGGFRGLREGGWAVQNQYRVDFRVADQGRKRVSASPVRRR